MEVDTGGPAPLPVAVAPLEGAFPWQDWRLGGSQLNAEVLLALKSSGARVPLDEPRTTVAQARACCLCRAALVRAR